MILRRLRLVNFRQLDGENVIDFAPPGAANVTVVLGENGSGKTTLLNAFKWCLYGEIDQENKDDILSHRALQSSDVGDELLCVVSLTFEHEGATYRACRMLRLQKNEVALAVPRDNSFDLTLLPDGGEPVPISSPRDAIEEMLPRQLAPFFFFHGEAAGHLASREGADSLREGVSECLNIGLLDRAAKHLGQVKKDLEADYREIASGDARALEDKISAVQDEIEARTAKRDEALRELEAIERLIAEKLRRLQESDELQPLVRELETSEASLATAKRELAGSEERLQKAIGRNAHFLFSRKSAEAVLRLVSTAYAKDELPARIKPGFVSELVRRQSCICGTAITPGSKEAEALSEFQMGSGLGDVAERLQVLENAMARVQQQATDAGSSMSEAREDWELRQSEVARTAGAISEVKRQIGGRKTVSTGEYDEIRGKYRQLEEDRVEHRAGVAELERIIGIGRYEGDDRSLNAELRRLEKERERLSRDNVRAQSIARQIGLASLLAETVASLKTGWLSVVQEYLDDRIRKVYAEVGQLNRRISFDSDFRLRMEELVDGYWRDSAPSDANQKVLAICFIASFIDLAKNVAESSRGESAPMLSTSEYPMVMDAPFAKMDSHFCTTVPRHLATVVPQIVLVTNYKQWSGEVASALKDRVGASYVLELHSAQGVSRSVDVLGREAQYTVRDERAAPDYSVSERVER